MGIKKLKKNLICVNKHTMQSSFTENIKEIENSICHIDFSILLYKMLLTSEDMDDVIVKIKNFFVKIKEKNILILYIDPEKNVKKEVLQKTRKREKNKFSNKLLEKINNEISVLKNFNLKLNQNYNEILDFKKEENYKTYIKKINIIKEDVVVENEKLIEDIILPKFTVKEYDSENEEQVFNPTLEPILEETEKDELSFLNKYEEKEEIKIEEIELPLIDKKKIFGYFITKTNYKFHTMYILEKLIEDNIISKQEIIYTKKIDAEVNIIKVIKDKCFEYNNVIFSVDQDIILFSVLNLKKKKISIKENYDTYTKTISLISNCNLTKNICILTFIFNQSDYFPGVKQFEINENKIKKFFEQNKNNKKLLKKKYNNIEVLCATFLQAFKIKEKDYANNINTNYIKEYFEQIKLYFSMEEKFYLSKNQLIYRFNINNLYYYLKTQKIPKLCVDGDKFFYEAF